MKNLSCLLLLLIGMGSASAQSFNKRLSTSPGVANFSGATDTLKILAVMVEFQEDKYDATTGTGKFGSHYSKVYGDTILDPLPHDANYFSDHLLFAKNYYKKVSKGKLELAYKVLPQVIMVSKYMRDYSPTYNSNDLSPIGKLAQEVWSIADQKFTGVKFSDYNLFVIFHAGVSIGLDLGTFGVDRNIPSVYLGNSSLKKIFGNQFAGFPTKTGQIGNTIILPETESREQEYVDGSTFLNQVSINGEIVNNIGNHIDLPDLFNTETGLSAIGRFGLMDAQSIGANYGMFPPEPSAWERVFLGWETPKTFSSKSLKVNIATRATAAPMDTTLLKIPINSSEYFLIENRQQDALKNKIVLTIRKSGQTITKTVSPDTSGYFNVTPDSVRGGVVIDVDEYDASGPGNGIVIWHIDDKIINAKIAENKINADPNNRGVSVVEADGVQEIGQQYETPFGTMIGDGNLQDLWYKGNKAKYYTNKFGVDTKPNTKNNSGANTYLTLENFSTISNKMSFSISYSQDAFTKLILPLAAGTKKTMTHLGNGSSDYFFITDNNNLYKFSTSGEKLFYAPSFSNYKPAAIYFNNTEVVVGAFDNKINLYIKRSGEEFIRTLSLNTIITAAPVIAYNNGDPFLYIGHLAGSVRKISLKNILESKFDEDILSYGPIAATVEQISAVDNHFFIAGKNQLGEVSGSWLNLPGNLIQLASSKSNSGLISTIVLSGTNQFTVMRNSKAFSQFTIQSSSAINSFSLAQVDNSGENSILVMNGNKLEAYNMYGKLVDGFPIILGKLNFSIAPLAMEIDPSPKMEIFSINSTGDMFAANQQGKLSLYGESVNLCASGKPLMLLYNSGQSTMTAVLDDTGTLALFKLASSAGDLGWSNIYGDETNSSSEIAGSGSSVSSEFLPADKAYNWPNPVYGNTTNFRFYIGSDADYAIRIFDLSGALVDNIFGRAIGGTENEVAWNVNKVQSGIYYANLEVNDSQGKFANKIIKIVVIK